MSGPDPSIADLSAMRLPLERYLRGLWNAQAPLIPIEVSEGVGNAMLVRPYLSNLGVHLPRVTAAVDDRQARALYFASAAHGGAHLAYSHHRFPRGGLRPVQVAIAGLLEDARVEWLAMAGLPGLRASWLPFHDAAPEHGGEVRILLRRLARALIDPGYHDPHPWVAKGLAFFQDREDGQPPFHDPARLREAASRLGNDIGQMRLQFNAKTYLVEPAYRDDNANLWLPDDASEEPPPLAYDDEDEAPAIAARMQAASDAAQPRARRHDEHAQRQEEGRIAQGSEPVQVETVPDDVLDASLIEARYPEWDHLIGAYRQDWARVLERVAKPPGHGTAPASDATAATRRSAPSSPLWQSRRLRAQAEGHALDIDAVVRARIDRQLGQDPDWRVWIRARRHRPALDVLILLDQSASTQGHVLETIRRAAIGSAVALQASGDHCAIDGFCSEGRSTVHYERYKDFTQPLDAKCRSVLAGMQARFSTRIGAALRHATARLTSGAAKRSHHGKLILLITDGEPHDIDVFDERYLIDDARQAVKEARSRHVATFCVSLDPDADRYVRRIFGRHGYLCVDRVEALLAKLPQVCDRIAS
jgi:Mg-chelatase subunit ChlD